MPATRRQIRLLALYGLLTYPFVCVPFLYFHFRNHGVDRADYLWMIAWYYWAMVVMEIPTGLFADRYGKKLAMAIGSATLATGFLVIHGSEGFSGFCVAQVILGIGHSLLSGPPTAMLFDSLAAVSRGEHFLLHESRIHAYRLLGTAGSFLLGGVLAQFAGFPATILATAALCLAGAIVVLFLREHRPVHTVRPALLRAAIADLRAPSLVWILVYFMLLFGMLRFCFHTYQPYFEETVLGDAGEYPWLILGSLFAALNLAAAPCSRLVPRLIERYPFRRIFPWLPASLGASFLLMAALPSWLGVLMFFLHQVPFGMHWAIIQEFVNRRIGPTARATVLSVLSFAGRVSFALWIPVVGYYQEANGTPAAYLAVGILGLALTLVWCAPAVTRRFLGPVARTDA